MVKHLPPAQVVIPGFWDGEKQMPPKYLGTFRNPEKQIPKHWCLSTILYNVWGSPPTKYIILLQTAKTINMITYIAQEIITDLPK